MSGSVNKVILIGNLGTGKSVLARAFIRAYCQTDEDIPSPTFNLVQNYDMGAAPVFHFDLYRLKSEEEVWELGVEEAFADGISLIEWPERLGNWLPINRLEILIMPGNEEKSRKIRLTGFGNWSTRVAENFGSGTKNA